MPKRTIVLDGVKHGTITGYVRGCGCAPCREAKRIHTKRWNMRRLSGEAGTVPGNVMREQVLELMNQYGLNIREMARATGFHRSHIGVFVNAKDDDFFFKKSFEKVLRMEFYTDEVKLRVPSRASALRMQAAGAIGWGVKELREFDRKLVDTSTLVKRGDNPMGVDTARRYIEFLELAVADPRPDSLGAKYNRGRGWIPPEAYDQDLLFYPYWDGKDGLIREARGIELLEEFEWLRSQGVSEPEALEKIGRDKDWLNTTRKRVNDRTAKKSERLDRGE